MFNHTTQKINKDIPIPYYYQLENIIKEVLEKSPSQVKEYKAGKETVLKFFIGQTMAATHGKANPKEIPKIINKLLK